MIFNHHIMQHRHRYTKLPDSNIISLFKHFVLILGPIPITIIRIYHLVPSEPSTMAVWGRRFRLAKSSGKCRWGRFSAKPRRVEMFVSWGQFPKMIRRTNIIFSQTELTITKITWLRRQSNPITPHSTHITSSWAQKKLIIYAGWVLVLLLASFSWSCLGGLFGSSVFLFATLVFFWCGDAVGRCLCWLASGTRARCLMFCFHSCFLFIVKVWLGMLLFFLGSGSSSLPGWCSWRLWFCCSRLLFFLCLAFLIVMVMCCNCSFFHIIGHVLRCFVKCWAQVFRKDMSGHFRALCLASGFKSFKSLTCCGCCFFFMLTSCSTSCSSSSSSSSFSPTSVSLGRVWVWVIFEFLVGVFKVIFCCCVTYRFSKDCLCLPHARMHKLQWMHQEQRAAMICCVQGPPGRTTHLH